MIKILDLNKIKEEIEIFENKEYIKMKQQILECKKYETAKSVGGRISGCKRRYETNVKIFILAIVKYYLFQKNIIYSQNMISLLSLSLFGSSITSRIQGYPIYYKEQTYYLPHNDDDYSYRKYFRYSKENFEKFINSDESKEFISICYREFNKNKTEELIKKTEYHSKEKIRKKFQFKEKIEEKL